MNVFCIYGCPELGRTGYKKVEGVSLFISSPQVAPLPLLINLSYLMRINTLFSVLITLQAASQAVLGSRGSSRGKLPKDFKWGTATAAYQIEGGALEGGRKWSIWDWYSHTYPNNIKNTATDPPTYGDTGDVADDSYHKFKEDVKLIKALGSPIYRLSFSWSRIFPDGHASSGPNPEGVAYYDNLINELLANGITPFVTLSHWDLPHALHLEYGGWVSYEVQDDFAAYADWVFSHFGDRVKNWITINEPWVVCILGYRYGPSKAPGRCTGGPDAGCTTEIGPTRLRNGTVLPANRAPDGVTEPIACSANLVLAHAKAAKIYREKYQKKQGGLVGFTVDGESQIPFDPKNPKDAEAAELAIQMRIGWYSDPVVFGDYPDSVKQRVGKDLIQFTEEEKKLLKGSVDFLGWNAYTTHWARFNGKPMVPGYTTATQDLFEDYCADRTSDYKCIGPFIGEVGGSSWLYKYPQGIRIGLNWFQNRYAGKIRHGLYITENGCSQPSPATSSNPVEWGNNTDSIIHDKWRSDFFSDYLEEIKKAVLVDGVDLRGYMGWSTIDNYEWENGYGTRFGMTYVDFNDPDRKRVPKDSYYSFRRWFKNNVEDVEFNYFEETIFGDIKPASIRKVEDGKFQVHHGPKFDSYDEACLKACKVQTDECTRRVNKTNVGTVSDCSNLQRRCQNVCANVDTYGPFYKSG
ncbi:hypothetical protein HDU97_002268 [Phlyctochytrium planicorne]|nr:hypothetical protein HDU97_002268 [Phlyctochytrium planicorne]